MRPLFLVMAFGALGAGIGGLLTHGTDQHAVSLGAIAGVLVGLIVDLAFHLGERLPARSA
jgi:Na+/proline symporter